MTTTIETGVNPTDQPDPLEQELSKDGLDVRITGPDGTTGAAAIHRAIDGALFDPAPYTDAVEIDGHSADKLKIGFAGSIELDPADDDARTLFESLRLGKPVDLRVAGHVNKKNGGWTENQEGETVVTGTAGIKITTLHLLTPEQLRT